MTKTERRKHWEVQVAAFKSSGMSVPKWCEEHDVKDYQLRYWLNKFNPNQPTNTTAVSKWVSVEVDEQGDRSMDSLLIKVGQATIEVKPGFDPALLADVVRTLKATC